MRFVFDASFKKLMEEILKVSFQVFIDDLVFNFEIFSFTDFSIIFYVHVSEPLVKVLRIVDGDKNPMGFLYEAMDREKRSFNTCIGQMRPNIDPYGTSLIVGGTDNSTNTFM